MMGYVQGEGCSHYDNVCLHLYKGIRPNIKITSEKLQPRDRVRGSLPSLVVFRCGTPLALLRVVTCGNASLDKIFAYLLLVDMILGLPRLLLRVTTCTWVDATSFWPVAGER
ncbi:hypothetical protein L3X38_045464 [Prunus dulcis]|uniref:Uncharacterized protein n=1 Tax=Prunus dulcis TaxID=3755 RepID=A0AAD4V1R1_PRUDU|nr:hypothetical protein L3X38_045464 [Prunus dulcis]